MHPITNHHGRRRASTSSHKNSKIKLNEALMAQCRYWISLLESIIFSSSLNVLLSKIHKDNSEEFDMFSLKKVEMELRYWIVKGKFAQCKNDIENAYSWYIKCKALLQSSTSLSPEAISINVKRYKSFVNTKRFLTL